MTLRRPMTRIEQSGARQMLEPILQAGWSNVSGGDLPIEESRSQEFDQGNLLAMSRFPAPDAREDGARLVYGLNWALHQSDGTKFAATAAQVLREEAHPGFTDSSGLGGTTSDFLLAGQLQLVSGIGLTARGLLDSSANFSKAEFRGDWKDERTSLSSSYLWLEADPAEGRGNRTSELWFDGSYQIDPNWSANANVRYDLFESDPSRAGLGFVYTNECVKVDLAVNRRYTSNSSVEPSTDFSFSIALGGFLADTGTQNYRRSCKNT
jgi:LPS-assembly protein